jgi:hypothetical protein
VTVEHVQSSVVVSKIVSKSTHTIDPDRSYWRKQTNKNAPADGQDVTNDSTHLSHMTRLSTWSRLGESNPRPTHYEPISMRCSPVQSPRLLEVRRVLMVVIISC